ncbi:TraE protein [Rhodanobacter denitrificans]|uniref:TraE protein n=1 Tax=Rhodanobacter denitrificans TaxID=666685 RepID=M4NG98_9GAMM|nr:TraE protein [Rhodanobacter denitrificans]AGG89107.1 TraE protein [Rhodanobacter denitrificans]UJJ52932.1 type IV conjugative transfer system protein TraE [Rhodanobacter denitrificans]
MNQEAAARRFSGLHQDNRALRLAVVASLLVNVVLVIGFVFRTQIVTIVPSNVMTKATYTANSADEGALSSWGLYLATLLGNVTPANADFTADSVGHLLAPGIYKDVMSGISDQVAKIKTGQLTLQFEPAAVKFDVTKSVVYVDGWLSTTDAHGTSQREERTYEIYFDVVNYQPRVVGLTSYLGKPHFGQ